jgi:hypothetical protein
MKELDMRQPRAYCCNLLKVEFTILQCVRF